MPTARARYRQRPVLETLERGDLERDNPGGGSPEPPDPSGLLLNDGSSFLLLTNTDRLLLAN